MLAVALFVLVVRSGAEIALSDSENVSVGDLTASQIEDRLQVRYGPISYITDMRHGLLRWLSG